MLFFIEKNWIFARTVKFLPKTTGSRFQPKLTKKLPKLNAFLSFPLDKNLQMADFLKYIQNTSDLQTVYQSVQKDSLNALSSNVPNSSLILDNSMDQS